MHVTALSLAVPTAGHEVDLVQANFDLVKFLEEEVVGYAGEDVEDGDWLDGAVVAMDRLVKNTEGSSGCAMKRIIMMTDMGCRANDDKLDQIVGAIQDQQIEFTFILPEWREDDKEDEPVCYWDELNVLRETFLTLNLGYFNISCGIWIFIWTMEIIGIWSIKAKGDRGR